MSKFEMNGIESIDVERLSDEWGTIQMTIQGEDGTTIVIDCGRFHDDAIALRDLLRETSDDIEKSIITGWEDVPDEHDGFVSFDRGRYYVHLEGSPWDGEMLHARNNRSNWRPKGFPSRDIATYELAAAMTASGYFPNAWHQDDRGYTDNIGEDVRKYHDDGGTDLLPLPGVEHEDGAEVSVRWRYQTGPSTWEYETSRAYIVKDYGNLGIVYVLSGDDEERFSEDRSDFVVTCFYCGEAIALDDSVTDCWLDSTGGDCCSGDDDLTNENETHTPVEK